MGKNRGVFFDNVKYFYLYLHRHQQENVAYYFLTEHKNVYQNLTKANLPVLFFPSFKTFVLLLQANIVVACDTPWTHRFKYHLLYSAKVVQLWHGIGLKQKGLSLKNDDSQTHAEKLHRTIRGNNLPADLFISSSPFFTENAFKKSFEADIFVECGNARNDLLFKEQYDQLDLIDTDIDVIDKITTYKNNGYRVILYAPTFRQLIASEITQQVLDINLLSEFSQKHDIIFVFKLHPYTKDNFNITSYKNLMSYKSDKDIQPLLGLSDILITDYSSVYIDFLLLDRPILFYAYDKTTYLKSERGLLFDYDWITPGPKCLTQDNLHKAIIDELGDADLYKKNRAEIRDIAFLHQDNKSSQRIWEYINDLFIK